MFTLDQIKAVHSKVKSGADFPAYIQDLRKLRVVHYGAFVEDGHTEFYGESDFKKTSSANYGVLEIAEIANEEQFKSYLKAHQKGQTDYQTFCKGAARSGIEKWAVDTVKMTCTYFDNLGRESWLKLFPNKYFLNYFGRKTKFLSKSFQYSIEVGRLHYRIHQ